jgi:hypothetical protein
VINDGFRNSPYYLANRNVLFSYSVNGVNVRADSMLSLTDVGLVNRGFVDLVAKISPTINFRLLGVSFYLSDFIYLFIDAAGHLLASGSQTRHAVWFYDYQRISQFALLLRESKCSVQLFC